MIINMNGDTYETLIRQYTALSTAIGPVEVALGNAAPHGRNYQRDPVNYPFDRATYDEACKGLAALRKFAALCAANLAANQRGEN